MGELTVSIAAHCALGVALAAVIWAVGLGMLVAAARDAAADHEVFAYPLGLLAVVAVAVAALLHPVAGIVGLAAAAVFVALFLGRLALFRAPLVRALRAVGWASPFVVAFPFAMGLLLHGPTQDVPSRAFGDYVFWATRAVSAEQSIAPFRDLLVVDRGAVYIEGASTFLGAALLTVPGVDVFLFQTTALPALALASLCVCFGLVSGDRVPSGRWDAVVLATLGLASVAYPTWLPESPPVALALPLGFTLFALWTRRLPARALIGVAVVVALDLYLTKGFVGLILLLLVGVAVARDHRASLRGWLDARGAAVGLGAVVVGVVSWRLGLFQGPTAVLPKPELGFVPADAVRGVFDQLETRDTHALAPAFEVAGQVVLAAALWRTRAFAFLAALVLGVVASWTIERYGFDLVVGEVFLLAALLWWTRPQLLASQRWLVAGAASLLAISAWFRDISGTRAGFVFVALFGAALLGALFGLQRARREYAYGAAATVCGVALALAGRPFLGFAVVLVLALVPLLVPRGRVAAAAAAAAAAISVAVSAAAARDDDFTLSDSALTLTTEHHGVWQAVAEHVPRDGLVYTSMTGEQIDGEHGWNYYPGIAGRQLYIGGWFDGPLLVEDAERARRFRINRLVLSGRMRATADPIARDFASHYAVVRRGERVPGSFRELYRNDRFALYRIA